MRDEIQIVGFLSLGFFILFFMFYMNRKLFNKVFMVLMTCAAVYIGVLVADKIIREEIRTYNNIEEVLEKNYQGYDVSYINEGCYYYLVLNHIEYELIKFEDGKYTAYDKVARYTKLAKEKYAKHLYTYTEKYQYKIGDEIVIIVIRDSDRLFADIYDDYGKWKYKKIKHDYYYINVLEKDQYDDEYKILVDTDDSTYQLIEYRFLIYNRFYWANVDYLE